MKPEDVAPRLESNDDSSNKRSKRRADQGTTEEPTECCGSVCRAVDVSDATAPDDQETRTLESGQDAEDEEGSQIGRQSSANAEAGEEDSGQYLGPSSAVNLTQGPKEDWRKTHEQHVESIAHVDNGAGGVESRGHLWTGRQNGRGCHGGQETTKCKYSDYADFLPGREAVVDVIPSFMVLHMRDVVCGGMCGYVSQTWPILFMDSNRLFLQIYVRRLFMRLRCLLDRP